VLTPQSSNAARKVVELLAEINNVIT